MRKGGGVLSMFLAERNYVDVVNYGEAIMVALVNLHEGETTRGL